MYQVILWIHQVLRPYARWNQSNRYKYNGQTLTAQQSAELINRLIDIRSDLWERSEAFHGDHAGSWYRIWGAMLFQLSHNYACDRSRIVELGSCQKTVRSLFFRKSLSTIIYTVAFYGDEKILKLGNEADPGKFEIDKNGSNAIRSIKATLEHYRNLSSENSEKISATLADFRNRIYLVNACH